ncbi:unnamed protein product [Soboliphyme baturini]|uniref:AAA_9 domain-containing protein n=1 Tax=Soboliphyme baturini TaxID=241478 RepID=A0A183IA27_9BILA|nr:unnamed protein product [Soboliphyme baturini]
MVVGGRIKYSINGVNVQNNRVFSLFESVNLNIDSPHFLIMQGRVTKVLNMKPKEVLATVEEAIGTRLYETSRNEALRGIETKDKELKEIGMEALLKSNDVIAELKKSVETLKEQIGEDEQRMAQLQKEIDLIHTTKNQVRVAYFDSCLFIAYLIFLA